ncbi:uncharacterized protein [Physcomitrium patens]|uniref:uncharacterized protein isoform X2 n=1 Tax=Physcomitrium patens TaxID=3218 RepID=UPI000D153208|nr:uncharacterized protein LOC112272672 isoform X2 [Physcomitrium patens]|eukprot:XP_024356426.1 uncharacterized protein LOC112272672 isoform X2 [Physcomitrella patens]
MCCLLLCVVACPAPALLLMQLHPPLPPCSLLSFSISCVSLAFSTLSCLAPWLTPLSTLPPPPPPRCRLNILACSKPMTSSAKPKSCDFLTPALPLCLFLPLPLPVLTSCYSRLSAFAGLNLASSIGRLTGSPRHPYTSKQQLHLSWQKYPIQRSYATKKLLQVKKDYHHCARPWTAGKHMESAGQLAKELGLIDEAVDSYRRASELFLHCGKVQPSADVLSRGARAVEDERSEIAVRMYLDACAMLEEDGREQMAFDNYRAAVNLYVKLNRFKDAAAVLVRWGQSADKCHATQSQCKAYLSAVIVHLYDEDLKQAQQCYNDCSQGVSTGLMRFPEVTRAKLLKSFYQHIVRETQMK